MNPIIQFRAWKEVMGIKRALLNFFVISILRVRWIINSDNELGIRVAGINMWYYKDSTPLVATTGTDDKFWRVITKREFGEVVKSHIK